MRFLLALLFLLGTTDWTAAQAQLTNPYPGATWDRIADAEANGYSSADLDEVLAYTETLNTDGLLVISGGRVLLEYGDLMQLSYLASVRKSVLAMLYGPYVADGTIDLDQTLADLGMDDVGGLSDAEKQATIRHLILARSGVYHPASNPGDNLADAPERGSQPPGSYYLYSNWDFNAAGAAFERTTGEDIYDALGDVLAAPIGMQDFDRAEQRKSGDATRSQYPAYHMWLSTRDMARLGYLMLREGRWNGAQVLPAEWVRESVHVHTPVEEMNPAWMREDPFGYGYMWWVWDGDTATGPYEGAYSARGAWGQYITVLPAVDLVIAHKTLPSNISSMDEYGEVSVSWEQYAGILDRVIAARCDGPCEP